MIGRRRPFLRPALDAHVAEQLARIDGALVEARRVVLDACPDDWRRLSGRVDELLEERMVFMQMRDGKGTR